MSYPYSMVVGSLKEFINKIPTMGVPEKINTKTLPAMGFKSKNDRVIASILQFIKLIDENGTPTENYKEFRNKAASGRVMAKCLKDAYSELYQLYPDAQKRPTDELRDFFAPKTSGGERVVTQLVSTFKTLAEFADFEALSKEPLPPMPDPIIDTSKGDKMLPQGLATGLTTGTKELVVNINIQITLPETKDGEVYDKIFESLAKHFFKH